MIRVATNRTTTFGLGLLALLFLVASVRLVQQRREERSPGRETVRFVHTHLEAGVREGFDEVARAYEALHPGVVVEQIAVPNRTYAMWLETKLTGRLTPDLVQIGVRTTAHDRGITDERVLRYFEPLGARVEEPNPYNNGTTHEGLPWRETFIDGLTSSPAYQPNLLNVYGIPNTIQTRRMFINLDLLRRITGSSATPASLGEFFALCERVHAYAGERETTLFPLAGPIPQEEIFGAVTQRLNARIEHTLKHEITPLDVAVGYLNGDWSFEAPAVRAGLRLFREIARQIPPGGNHLSREDALFLFAQQRALMFFTDSSDYGSIRAQVGFPVTAFRLPAPAFDDPVYGYGTLGGVTEVSAGGQLVFAVSRDSPQRERAIDFLRFLTSQRGAAMFARRSGWISAVRDVPVPEELRMLEPVVPGFVRGMSPVVGGETTRVFNQYLHELTGPGGGVERFVAAMRDPYERALRSDLQQGIHSVVLNSMIYDTVLGALWWQQAHEPGTDARLSEVVESQNFQEQISFWRRHEALRSRTDGAP